jgi:hypothetical protein
MVNSCVLRECGCIRGCKRYARERTEGDTIVAAASPEFLMALENGEANPIGSGRRARRCC